jgi:hypothetical protein
MDPKEFKRQYMNEGPSEEWTRVKIFLDQTQKRLWELGDKKQRYGLTRTEEFELDMCRGDVRRAKEFLKNGKRS